MGIYDRVVVLGTGKIAASCIDILAGHTNEVIGIEQEEQALSGVQLACRKHDLPYLFIPDKLDLTAYLEAIQQKVLVVSANNNYLFPQRILEKSNLRIVNFHNALLPSYPGRNAPTWVIYEQEQVTGITWHIVNEGVDTGDIVDQVRVPVGTTVTALELTRKCMEAGIVAFAAMIPRVLNEQFECQRQDLLQRKHFHRSDEIPNGGYLDLAWPFMKVSAFLRSLDYGKVKVLPSPRVRLQDRDYRIKKYKMCQSLQSERQIRFQPGELMFQADGWTVQMELERGAEDEQHNRDNPGDQTGN